MRLPLMLKPPALLALGIGFFVSMQKSQAQSDQSKDRKEYADQVRDSYNFHFGTDKWALPGNASVQGNDFLHPGAFPKATYCAHCHEEAYAQCVRRCTQTRSERRFTVPA